MVTELIERAWREERRKWVIGAPDVDGNSAVLTGIARVAVFIGSEADCQAHLDRLCALAVEKALAAAGLAIVPVEPTEAMDRACASICGQHSYGDALDAYRAMLTAAQEDR
jgi:predicted CoA-binding protein